MEPEHLKTGQSISNGIVCTSNVRDKNRELVGYSATNEVHIKEGLQEEPLAQISTTDWLSQWKSSFLPL